MGLGQLAGRFAGTSSPTGHPAHRAIITQGGFPTTSRVFAALGRTTTRTTSGAPCPPTAGFFPRPSLINKRASWR